MTATPAGLPAATLPVIPTVTPTAVLSITVTTVPTNTVPTVPPPTVASPEQPTATAVPGTTGTEQVYTVKAGDNLFRIGLNYGCTVDQLSAYNNIPAPYIIYPGQQIRIPPTC
jgi:LysM repeat protein